MKVWWCASEEATRKGGCILFSDEAAGKGRHVGCGPMRLIPDNARWFIERESGRRIAGPFTTQDDANYARTWVEKVLKPETFWIRLDGETP